MKRTLCTFKTFIIRSYNINTSRYLSTQEAIERRNHLFNLEKKRQLENVGRIEKIEVKYKGLPEDCTLIMNKDISTPHDCARHLSEWHIESSALALINGSINWDMHRPLTESCTLEFQNFTMPEPQNVNKAFWRTCSFMLGACASVAFKDTCTVKLHSFPGPDIRSGSFIYDIDLPDLPSWTPTEQELRTLSAEYVKLCRKVTPIERLEVSKELGLEMFKDNEHKFAQIPNIVRKANNGKITLYRVGNHVDISKGPMVSNVGQIGKVTVASVHRITGKFEDSPVTQLYRFQGVALPTRIILNQFTYRILEDRARKSSTVPSPFSPYRDYNHLKKRATS